MPVAEVGPATGPDSPATVDDNAANVRPMASLVGPASPIMPGPSFDGLDSSANTNNNTRPPDPQAAAGPENLFETVNHKGRVLTRSGTVVNTFDLPSFFSVPTGWTSYDPTVLYDRSSGRFLATYLSYGSSNQSRIHFSYSLTSDANGSWATTYIERLGSGFFDFAHMGFTDDKVVITVNWISFEPESGIQAYVLEKFDVLMNRPITTSLLVIGNDPSVQPAQSLSTTSDQWMARMNVNQATMIVYRVTGTPDAGNVSISSTSHAILQHNIAPNAQSSGLADLVDTQPGGQGTLDATWSNDTLWVGGTAACVPTGDTTSRACLHIVAINTVTISKSQEVMFGAAGKYYFMPGLSLDVGLNLYLIFAASSATEFVQARTTGRLASDPSNTLQASALVRLGDIPLNDYAGSPERWGDYFSVSLDPLDTGCVWLTGEYAKDVPGARWGTYISRATFGPGCQDGQSRNIRFGDVDCTTTVDSVDSLKIQRYVSGLSYTQNEPCPDIGRTVNVTGFGARLAGDVQCDKDVDAVDADMLLRWVAGLSVTQVQPCPVIGSTYKTWWSGS